jgi:hypothetical protein
MYSMRCDHPGGCSAELDTDYGGAWLYETIEEARAAARDYDWVTDDRGRDFCWDHRANHPDYADGSS